MKLSGKTCLVTGANSGIGKVTALELAKQQARVIMLCRNKQKAEAAHHEIFKISGNEQVHILLCDLASQQQVRQAAQTVQQQFGSLDILINNAGLILGNKRQETEDGLEKTFAVNHLAPFSLTLLLLELLQKSPQGRIINVSSEAHRYARFSMEDLQLKHHAYNGFNAYCISKLCNIWFTRELARRFSNSFSNSFSNGNGNSNRNSNSNGNLKANCLHPGFVSSNFGKSNSAFFKIFLRLLEPFAVSPEKGAETSLYLACNEETPQISGKYFKDKEIKKPSKAALNDTYAGRLWRQSELLSQIDSQGLLPK